MIVTWENEGFYGKELGTKLSAENGKWDSARQSLSGQWENPFLLWHQTYQHIIHPSLLGWIPRPQVWGFEEVWGSSPHALSLSSSSDQAHTDHPPKQGVVIRLSGVTRRVSAPTNWIYKEIFLHYVCMCLCLMLLHIATGFCTGQTKPRTFSYLIPNIYIYIYRLKLMDLCKRSFHSK